MRSMTAVVALVAAAGFAGAAQAQSLTPTGTSPTQNMQSTQYTGQNPTQPYGGQYNPYAAQPQPQPNNAQSNAAQQRQANPQWNAAQQQSTPGTANWNQPQQPGMQRPGMASQAGMLPPAGGQIAGNEVRQAQEMLREQGLYRGRADGVIGSSTKRAIAQFQRRNGLPVTGSLDEATLSGLNGQSPQGYGTSAAQAQPIAAPRMNQAPSAGAYNPNTGAYNTAGTNAQGYPPPQR